jgi:hypothetical protein
MITRNGAQCIPKIESDERLSIIASIWYFHFWKPLPEHDHALWYPLTHGWDRHRYFEYAWIGGRWGWRPRAIWKSMFISSYCWFNLIVLWSSADESAHLLGILRIFRAAVPRRNHINQGKATVRVPLFIVCWRDTPLLEVVTVATTLNHTGNYMWVTGRYS